MRGMRLLRLASLGTKAVEKKGVLSQDFSTVLFKIISSFRHLDLVSNGVALVLLGTGGALGIPGHVGHVAQFQ